MEEILYPAMEDHVLDLMIGEGPSARSIRIDLAPFTLVAATTRAGLLATPLRDRFGIPLRLEFYTPAELQPGAGCTRPARWARRCPPTAPTRSPPAPAARRASPAACCAGSATSPPPTGADVIDRKASPPRALARLEVDEAGLDSLDRRYLRALIENYGGGPVGVETLAYAIAEARDAVEDVIEPFLMQQGFIQRTPRGRVACAKAYAHLGLDRARRRSPRQAGPVRGAVMSRSPPRGWLDGREHRFAGAHLLRGHRLHRRRLPRQLPALSSSGAAPTSCGWPASATPSLLAMAEPTAFVVTRMEIDFARPARHRRRPAGATHLRRASRARACSSASASTRRKS